mgnify:CR=1 FL=1
MLEGNALLEAVGDCSLQTLQGEFYRYVNLKRASEPLSTIGSRKVGGRYNAVNAFEVLYLADTPVTALAEIRAITLNDTLFVGVPQPPKALFTVSVKLKRVLKLCTPEVHALRGSLFKLREKLDQRNS